MKRTTGNRSGKWSDLLIALLVLGLGGPAKADEPTDTMLTRALNPDFNPMRKKKQEPQPPATQPSQRLEDLLEWDQATGNWWQARSWLAQRGLTIEPTLLIDSTVNFRGGADTAGSSTRHLFDLAVAFDMERLVGLEGGVFFFDYLCQNGDDPAENLTGDLQGTSNADADGRSQIAEIWYEQTLLDGAVRLKLGKIDANSDFAYADYAGEVVHGIPSCPVTVLDFPTYPDPAFGILAFVYPADWLYAGIGLWDGALHEGYRTGERGPKTAFNDPADLFVIGEIGLTWEPDCGRDGRVGIGGWGHTGSFERFDGSVDRGSQGFYVVLDQTLWLENPDAEDDPQGIGFYFQFGWADHRVSEITANIAGGFQWTGALPGRDQDVCGLSVSSAVLTDDPAAGFTDDHETNIELFYKIQLTPWISIKPDLQYIIHPGGMGADDALAGTLRIEISF